MDNDAKSNCLRTDLICSDPQSPFQEPFHPKLSLMVKLILLVIGIAGGVCAIVFDHNDWAAIITSGIFWFAFYILLLNTLVDNCEGLRVKCYEGSTRAEVLVSLFHQFGLCLVACVVFLGLHVNNDFSSWWKDGPIYAFSFERQVQVSIFGYELKDVAYGCIHWTWLIHHGLTFIGCVFVLNMPAGLGLVTLNGLIAEMGSGIYNLNVIWPNSCTAIAYFIGMFISNGLVAAFAVLLFYVDNMAIGWKVCYGIIVLLLFILRTEGLRRAICEFRKEKEDAPAEGTDSSHANQPVQIPEPKGSC